MIIGSGLVASAFRPYWEDDREVVVFASGVSNSRETRSEEFARERDLLQRYANTDAFLLYFSTCSIEDPSLSTAPYVRHKREMEEMVGGSPRSAVFRLPQVVGDTKNPHTLTNYLYRQIESGTPFQLWKGASRNLIDISDVAQIVVHLVKTASAPRVANIACPFSISVLDLVKTFELVLGKKAFYDLVEGGGSYAIETSLAAQTAERLGIRFDASYVESVLRKYYG